MDDIRRLKNTIMKKIYEHRQKPEYKSVCFRPHRSKEENLKTFTKYLDFYVANPEHIEALANHEFIQDKVIIDETRDIKI